MPMSEYEQLRDAGWRAMAQGDLAEAREHLEAAREVARGLVDEDEEIIDKAEVNLAMIRLQLHEDDAAERGLRAVLLRSTNDDVKRLAAHCLAKILSRRGEHDRALRFARTSLERASVQADPLKVCSALQLIGHVQVNCSHLEDGLENYRQARELLAEHPLSDQALHAFYETTVDDMIGYIHVLQGDAVGGLAILEPSLEQARRHGIKELEAEISGDICLALVHLGRFDEALEHGMAMLRLARQLGLPHYERNAYYLLGEACSRAGRTNEADGWFDSLATFYPNVPFLREFLSEYDISSLVNLKEFA